MNNYEVFKVYNLLVDFLFVFVGQIPTQSSNSTKMSGSCMWHAACSTV